MKVPYSVTPRTQAPDRTKSLVSESGNIRASGQLMSQSLGGAANALGQLGQAFQVQKDSAERFRTLKSFQEFQYNTNTNLTQAKQQADPAQANFVEQADAIYSNAETEWLATVPDNLYDEFSTRATEHKFGVLTDAMDFQFKSTDAYFKQGVLDATDAARISLDQDGTVTNLDNQRKTIDEYIETSALNEAEKVTLRRKAYTDIESAAYRSEVRKGHIEAGALGVGAGMKGTAEDLIREFDGLSLETGLSPEENSALLDTRMSAAEQMAVEKIGSLDLWAAMPDRARAALISLVDDKGELPTRVAQAVHSGDLEEVAKAVAAQGGDRRATEADIIRGIENLPEGKLDSDPRFANIPYEDRLALRADAERQAAAVLTAQTAADKALQASQVNSLFVQLHDGTAGMADIHRAREQGVLTDVDDITKAEKYVEDNTKQLKLVQEGQAKLASGGIFDPSSDDDRKRLNALVGEQGLSAIQNRSPDYVENQLIPMVRQSKDIPTDVIGTLTGMMRSSDSQKSLYALDLLSQLQQAAPDAYDARTSATVAADVAYWQQNKEFYDKDTLAKQISGGLDQQSRTMQENLRTEAKTLLTGNNPKVVLDPVSLFPDQNGIFWGGQPTTGIRRNESIALTSDYNELFVEEYARDGNVDKAKVRAEAALKRVWTVTNVGGEPKIMKYAPEAVGYPKVNGSYDWIDIQLRAEMNLPTSTTFQLVSDDQTRMEFQKWQQEGGQPPSYIVTTQDKDGNIRMATTPEGLPERRFFEVTDEMKAAELQEFNTKNEVKNYQDFMNMYNVARQHSMETGIPIPDDIKQDYTDWQEKINPTPKEKNGGPDLSPVENTFLGALRTAESSGLGGTSLRLYNDIIQRGRTEPITENDFSPEEQTSLKQLVMRVAGNKTEGKVDYKDYKDQFDHNVLGGFKYKIKDGVITITDTWDFNADRADGTEGNVWLQALAGVVSPRNLASSIGRKKLADNSGKGIPVKITLK